MKIVKSLSAAFVAALITAACGGGGGDSSPTPVVPVVVVTPPVVPVTVTCPNGSIVASATDCPAVVVTPPTPVVVTTVTCPNGSVVAKASDCPVVPVPVTVTCPNGSTVASATDCPAVGTAPIALQGTVMSPTALDNGVTIQFNGALVPSSVVVLFKQGNSLLGSTWTTTITGGNKDVTFKPTVRLAYGQSYTVVITANDTIGRAVSVTFSFTTSTMTCSSNAVWSNPAIFSAVYQDCVAPVGVQALVTPSLNTMTDNSCVVAVGVPLTASCKAYMANGTMLLADTPVIVKNNHTVWMSFIGTDLKSNLVLLDTTTMAPIGMMVLPGDLAWIIGNPTGSAVSVKVGTLLRNEQVKWDGAALAVTCYSNCS